ncbi:MAG TPA: PHP domain-containing protein, partial [Patescibacteria group bacterium]|nr:PHP domain-containing protein [Patescibacteria group bacterium]
MITADLHIHTIASDGSWTPVQLVDNIREMGIQVFAVTDHDSVGSVAATAQLAKQYDLCFLPGVEVCSTSRGHQFHILGYGIDFQSHQLQCLLQHNTQLMEETDRQCIRQLAARRLPGVDYNEYLGYRYKAERGGWKSLNYLMDKGLCQGVKDFFERLFTTENEIQFPEFPAPVAVIDTIRSAGGVAVLAHPGSEFHGTVLEETLECFYEESIDGVECFHPGHDRDTTAMAREWCLRHQLLMTGGSDCHGSFVPGRRLGHPQINLADLNLGRILQVDKSPL